MQAEQKWMEYLSHRSNVVNYERVSSVKEISGYETKEYVLRTLKILQKYKYTLSAFQYQLIERTLQWSEVAKCGSKEDHERWEKEHIVPIIHNVASAAIYHMDVTDSCPEEDREFNRIVEILIMTHGLLGQAIRGEVKVSDSMELRCLLDYMNVYGAERIVYILNECIISAVDIFIWNEVEEEIKNLIRGIFDGKKFEYSIDYRISKLLPNVTPTGEIKELVCLFADYQLWYMAPAFKDIPTDTTVKLLKGINRKISEKNWYSSRRLTNIMFQPLMQSLYYDYKGTKKINIYKLRVVQNCLDNGLETEHCKLVCNIETDSEGSTLYVDFKFSEACEALLDFCVKAENSNILTYEKSITLIFDIFGFRLDMLDRLNNEDSYLSTMNDTETSTKESILDYIIGTDVVDVGSGGGVLLDKIEEKYLHINIIGTDISKAVIDKLEEKARTENHRWKVLKHNFVDDRLETRVNNIIFSSILHEIYSYTEYEGKKFNIDSVKTAIKNAYRSLKPNGRIIIRDGIKTDSNESLTVTFKDKSGYDFFKNYINDFKGPLNHEYTETTILDNGTTLYQVTGDINLMREFLYTYTWGQESYAHEVQEQFGYLTLNEYKELLEKIGFTIIEAKEFLEEGYPNHLKDKVILDKEYPNSNCIIVAEKSFCE